MVRKYCTEYPQEVCDFINRHPDINVISINTYGHYGQFCLFYEENETGVKPLKKKKL